MITFTYFDVFFLICLCVCKTKLNAPKQQSEGTVYEFLIYHTFTSAKSNIQIITITRYLF